MKTFFSYDHENAIRFHETAAEAKAAAEEAFQYDQDDAIDDGWNEEVHLTCWGQVREKVVCISEKKSERPQFDVEVEYRLTELP